MTQVNTQGKVIFEYLYKKAYRGNKGRKVQINEDAQKPSSINPDYPLHWYDKICYVVLQRKVLLKSDIREIQFFVENKEDWWSCKNVVDEQRKFLKAVYESALLIGTSSRLHTIHYFFDTNNDVALTIGYYVNENDQGPPDDYIVHRMNEEIRKRYDGLVDPEPEEDVVKVETGPSVEVGVAA